MVARCTGRGSASTLTRVSKELERLHNKAGTVDTQHLLDEQGNTAMGEDERFDTKFIGIGGMSMLEKVLSQNNKMQLGQTSEISFGDDIDIVSTKKSLPRRTFIQDENKNSVESSKSPLFSLISLGGGFLETIGSVLILDAYTENFVLNGVEIGDGDQNSVKSKGVKSILSTIQDDKLKAGKGLLIEGKKLRISVKSQELSDDQGPVKMSVKDMLRTGIKSQSTKWSVSKY
jgi:hypothetical protein